MKRKGQWRENTNKEKRKMRREIKKRKRHLNREKQKRDAEQKEKMQLEDAVNEAQRYKCLAQKYMRLWKAIATKNRSKGTNSNLKHINRNDLIDVDQADLPVGKGVYGKCYLKMYQSNFVAVKEFKKKVSKADAVREATMLSKFSHPGLPVILGIDITTNPWLMVSLFYGINQRNTTLYELLNSESNEFNLDQREGLSIITQLGQTLKYLHDNGILHNDIKTDNIMISKDALQFRAILIDFGKACSFVEAKKKQLSEETKIVYRKQHAHIAPEIVEGNLKQSPASDIYSLGRVISKVGEFCKCGEIIMLSKSCLSDLRKRCTMTFILEECEILQKQWAKSKST